MSRRRYVLCCSQYSKYSLNSSRNQPMTLPVRRKVGSSTHPNIKTFLYIEPQGKKKHPRESHLHVWNQSEMCKWDSLWWVLEPTFLYSYPWRPGQSTWDSLPPHVGGPGNGELIQSLVFCDSFVQTQVRAVIKTHISITKQSSGICWHAFWVFLL